MWEKDIIWRKGRSKSKQLLCQKRKMLEAFSEKMKISCSFRFRSRQRSLSNVHCWVFSFSASNKNTTVSYLLTIFSHFHLLLELKMWQFFLETSLSATIYCCLLLALFCFFISSLVKCARTILFIKKNRCSGPLWDV